MSHNTETVTLTVTLPTRCIEQFAQFCKRTGYDDAFNKTEPHLNQSERRDRAYQMLNSIAAIETALKAIAHLPR